MAVIINELEVVLEPPPAPAPTGGQTVAPEKPKLNPQDFLTVWDREQRNDLRLRAH